MAPPKGKGKAKAEAPTSTSAGTQTEAIGPISPPPPSNIKESIIAAAPPKFDSPTTSPTFQTPAKTPPRKILRLKCPTCNDYPDGFRSEHELRRHTNRVHRRTRKVWVTIDTSPDKSFLANCKACQSGKKYNECYNAASHLRRMHFHPHKRGERKMSAAEARRGGKPGDLDPPMEVLKANWLREVEEAVGDAAEDQIMAEAEEARPPSQPKTETHPPNQTQLQPQQPPQPSEAKAPPTPTTPSTRSMAIDSIVDKVDAQ